MLWLAVVVALAVGWWLDRAKLMTNLGRFEKLSPWADRIDELQLDILRLQSKVNELHQDNIELRFRLQHDPPAIH
jgi:hypothetical protein